MESPTNRIKRGCPYCSNKKIKYGFNDLETTHPSLIVEWNYEKNTGINPKDFSYGSEKKVWWKCLKCGYEYSMEIYHRTKGRGCPCCSGKKIWIGHNDLGTLYPNLVKEWNYTKNKKLPHEYTKGNSTDGIWWKCSKCGNEWKTTICNRTNRHSGCPKCSRKKHN